MLVHRGAGMKQKVPRRHLDDRGLSGKGSEVVVEHTQTNDVHSQAQELGLHVCLLHNGTAKLSYTSLHTALLACNPCLSQIANELL